MVRSFSNNEGRGGIQDILNDFKNKNKISLEERLKMIQASKVEEKNNMRVKSEDSGSGTAKDDQPDQEPYKKEPLKKRREFSKTSEIEPGLESNFLGTARARGILKETWEESPLPQGLKESLDVSTASLQQLILSPLERYKLQVGTINTRKWKSSVKRGWK